MMQATMAELEAALQILAREIERLKLERTALEMLHAGAITDRNLLQARADAREKEIEELSTRIAGLKPRGLADPDRERKNWEYN
jgi:chromosome segregation ATPase